MDALPTHFRPGVLLNRRYESISPLNHGSFGMVMMARDRYTRNLVAVKCFTNPSATPEQSPGFKIDERSEELKIHSRIGNHAHIVNLLDYFSTASHTYLVLEYCSMGDLYEAIRQDKGPKETGHVREFMLQLVRAVEFLHAKGIYHRDIKPENIFLTGNGDMKLGDFGLATSDAWSYESAVGSDRYMAPEQYDPAGNGLSPAKADIWSIGICLLNILFSRNPFGVPAMTDPLFADYVRDRQSLFDVFPNMSQDTFEVLNHCLGIDPMKRDLSLVKDALERVVSFTTDDESLDEFCTENRDVNFATANRLPLRTPSISTPNPDQKEFFPWAKALHLTSPKSNLSVVRDSEPSPEQELFPGSAISTQDWLDKADAQSFDSVVDSGLGVSITSSQFRPDSSMSRSKPLPIAGSLPLLGNRASSTLTSIFGKKKPFESKSWSDLFDEDEEEARAELERQRRANARADMASRPSKLPMLSQEDDSDDGRSTPRAPLPNDNRIVDSADVSPTDTENKAIKHNDNVSQHTGFVFEDDKGQVPLPPSPTAKYSPPRRTTLVDKWAALGEMRRRVSNNPDSTPTASKSVPATSEQARRRFRPATWRRNLGLSRQSAQQPHDLKVWQQKEWNMSRDWRRSEQDLHRSPLGVHPSQLDGYTDVFAEEDSDEDFLIGDLHL